MIAEDEVYYKKMNKNQLDDEFVNACNKGHLEVVKYLLTSSDLKKHANIHKTEDSGFILSCRANHLEIVKYLLTSSDLKEHAHIHAQNNAAFIGACIYGALDIVKYLLMSPDLKEHVNIHVDDNLGVRSACWNGHLQLANYLLISSELKEHADIHADNDEAFINICKYPKNKDDIIQYLIFDYQIEKTKHIELFLIENKKEDIINMFERRDFEKTLQTELKNENEIKKNNKMKI